MNTKKIYSVSDYVEALKRVDISPHHLHMLQAHYNAPHRDITATRLAKRMNYKKYNGVNLHYGKFAAQLGKQLGCRQLPDPRLDILVKFENRNNEWHWIMRPNLAEALEKLGKT